MTFWNGEWMRKPKQAWAWYLRQPRYVQVVIALVILWLVLNVGGVDSIPIPDAPFIPDR